MLLWLVTLPNTYATSVMSMLVLSVHPKLFYYLVISTHSICMDLYEAVLVLSLVLWDGSETVTVEVPLTIVYGKYFLYT